MNLVLMTQYFDMLKEIGASSRTNAILIPHSPGNLTTLTEQMRNAMIEADQTVQASGSRRESSPMPVATPPIPAVLGTDALLNITGDRS
jgi:hypothetical protein